MNLDKPTDELESILANTKPSDVAAFIEKNKEYMVIDDEKHKIKKFYIYYTDTIKRHKVKLKDAYSFAGLSGSFGSKIVREEKHTTDRDCILRLCIAGRFDLQEINRALKLYGMSELYVKDPRDACIMAKVIHATKHKNNRLTMDELDDFLIQNKQQKITKDEKNIT